VTVRIAIDQKDPASCRKWVSGWRFWAPRRSGRRANGRSRCDAPAGAVQSSGETGIVYVLRGSTVERRAVKLGASNGERVVILAGVTAGERVAVGDFSKLKNGAEIHIEP